FLVETSYETPPAPLPHSGAAFCQEDPEAFASGRQRAPVPVAHAAPAANSAGALRVATSSSFRPVSSKSGTSLAAPGARSHMMPPSSVQLISQEQLLEVLTPFATQFRLMQEQMFEQFQQSLLTMFDMFSTLHRDQTSAIRQELDDLKRVTQEIQELRKEMAE